MVDKNEALLTDCFHLNVWYRMKPYIVRKRVSATQLPHPDFKIISSSINGVINQAIVYFRCRSYLAWCVFIFFHDEGFFCLQNVQDMLEDRDQRSYVVNISWLLYATFHHRCMWKCHISPPKTKTPVVLLLETKRYDIMRSAERWYILI